MNTKLKLRIKLFDELDSSNTGTVLLLYRASIEVLEKDVRFEADVDSKLLFYDSDEFTIRTHVNKPKGSILDNGLLIPSTENLGTIHIATFYTDKDRFNFLKKLYNTIDSWSNLWWGYDFDEISDIVVDGDTWTVVCETVYNGGLSLLSNCTDKEHLHQEY